MALQFIPHQQIHTPYIMYDICFSFQFSTHKNYLRGIFQSGFTNFIQKTWSNQNGHKKMQGCNKKRHTTTLHRQQTWTYPSILLIRRFSLIRAIFSRSCSVFLMAARLTAGTWTSSFFAALESSIYKHQEN